MAGTVKDSFGGINVVADNLFPHRLPHVMCGPMHLSTATADQVTIDDSTVTGTLTLYNPPYVTGPDNHIWVPIGPVTVTAGPTATMLTRVPLGPGSWFADMILVGTGTVPTDLFHAEIRFSMSSTGTAVTVITTSTSFQISNGAMTTTPPTITINGGTNNVLVEVTSFENSKWSGYMKLVGAGVYP